MRLAFLLACAAIACAAVGCGGGSSASHSPRTTSGSGAGDRESLPRDQDLAAACPRIYGRAIALARAATPESLGPLTRRRVRSLGFSGCEIGTKRSPGVNVHVTLDTAPHVLQGYANRIGESEQFSSRTKGLAPVPVRGVGDRKVGGGGANWLPVLSQLLSVRGRHMLAVTFYAHGVPLSTRERMAKRIALLGWSRLGVPRR